MVRQSAARKNFGGTPPTEPLSESPPAKNPENVFPVGSLPPPALKPLFSVHSQIKTVSYVTLRVYLP